MPSRRLFKLSIPQCWNTPKDHLSGRILASEELPHGWILQLKSSWDRFEWEHVHSSAGWSFPGWKWAEFDRDRLVGGERISLRGESGS
jgi:hypothetical protein